MRKFREMSCHQVAASPIHILRVRGFANYKNNVSNEGRATSYWSDDFLSVYPGGGK